MTGTHTLETYFAPFRKNVVGNLQEFDTPYGRKRIVYADWTASGRMYQPIETRMAEVFHPFVGNTHTETSVTGTAMTQAYHEARHIIKEHVKARPDDILICCDSGMTGAVNKLQRIIGVRVPFVLRKHVNLPDEERPVVFVTHMEHHSNHTSWIETFCHVEVIAADDQGLVDLKSLEGLLEKHKSRRIKIAAVTSCSNVTGIGTPYHKIAAMMHDAGGLCFVDFACSAPYIDIAMHTDDERERLDAIYFSPHKFLGGPGTPGVLIFNASLYRNEVPDHPGGGTVTWTNPWGGHHYIEDIEAREDGGTPPFLQTIRTALAIRLKESMRSELMLQREEEMLAKIFDRMTRIPNLHILAGQHQHRLGVVSFYIDKLHFNLAVKLLNDRFGVQVRGGCSCAGTYGHYLLNVTQEHSRSITDHIDLGNLSDKPGWIRMSIHPVMTDEDIEHILSAIEQVSEHHVSWAADYIYDKHTNEFTHKDGDISALDMSHSFAI